MGCVKSGDETFEHDVLIEAAERLKQQTAEVLHGRIQTRLFVTAYRLEQCRRLLETDPKHALDLLRRAQDELDDVRERDVREVSHLLHPSIIRVGLLPALRGLVRRFDGCFHVCLLVSDKVDRLDRPDDPQIPEQVRLTCYRIVEEALSNVARHAKATGVKIALTINAAGELLFCVVDDGVGFSPRTARLGFGLRTVVARVARAAGRFDVFGRVGAETGTIVRVRLPLTMPRAAGSGTSCTSLFASSFTSAMTSALTPAFVASLGRDVSVEDAGGSSLAIGEKFGQARRRG